MSVVGDKSLDPHLEERLNIISGIAPVEFVQSQPCAPPPSMAPYLDKILIYSVHGGDVIPEKFYEALLRSYPSEDKLHHTLLHSYCREKDWGANQVAAALARELGLSGFWRVNIARALLDFGRLPGITPADANHLDRYAINYPFSYYLDFDGKRDLLQECFDAISKVIEREISGKSLVLGIHSYDHRNPTLHYTQSGTIRPEVSLIFRGSSFQALKHMPKGLYDPLYPDQLAESSADRRLTARLSLMLERAGIAVTHNYPYFLPDGSLEVRSQVWDYFRFLKECFEARFAETRNDPAYKIVWNMLLDTNLRSSASEAFRSYLHMFRTAPPGSKLLFRKAQRAYVHVSDFFTVEEEDILTRYRKSPDRQSALAMEVRKDLVWKFHDHNTSDPYLGPDGALQTNARHIAGLMARGVATYFREDRQVTGAELPETLPKPAIEESAILQ